MNGLFFAGNGVFVPFHRSVKDAYFDKWFATAGHAIPYGCKGCMFYYAWGAEKIPDYALLRKSVLMTNSIYIFSPGPEAKGKRFSCALCWVSICGEMGPLSEIYHTIVL